MKKILILTIALLFVAGFAMAELKVTSKLEYGFGAFIMSEDQLSGDATVNIYIKGGNDFTTAAIDLGGKVSNGFVVGTSTYIYGVLNEGYINLDVLGALGVEGVPLKITTLFGFENLEAGRQKVTKLGIEDVNTKKGPGDGACFAVTAVIMDMVTLKVMHTTNAKNSGTMTWANGVAIAPITIEAKATIEFITVSAYTQLAKASAAADMSAAVYGGLKVELAKILGVDLISALSIAANAGSPDLLLTVGQSMELGAGLIVDLAPMDMVTVHFGLSTQNKYLNANSAMFQNLGIEVEFMYDKFGVGATALLSLGDKDNATANAIMQQIGIFGIAKLSGVTMQLGFVMNPDVGTAQAGDLVGSNKKAYGWNTPTNNANGGITFKTSVTL
jgi:hypothetical protein